MAAPPGQSQNLAFVRFANGLRTCEFILLGSSLVMIAISYVSYFQMGDWAGKWVEVKKNAAFGFICQQPQSMVCASTKLPCNNACVLDTCFFAHRAARSWDDALSRCIMEASQLATVTNSAADGIGLRLCAQTGESYCFMGLHKPSGAQRGSDWIWSSGAATHYTNWAPRGAEEYSGDETAAAWQTEKGYDERRQGIRLSLVFTTISFTICLSLFASSVFCQFHAARQKSKWYMTMSAVCDGALAGLFVLGATGCFLRRDVWIGAFNLSCSLTFMIGSIVTGRHCKNMNLKELNQRSTDAIGRIDLEPVGQAIAVQCGTK